MPVDTDDPRWTAVVERDPAGVVGVYAVRTTGVYCSFGCASRRPRRDNVEFFADASSAEHHGFRPCRRCRPDVDPGAEDADVQRVRLACELLADDRPEDSAGRIPIAEVAGRLGCSTRQLQRSFISVIGVGPAAYRREVERARARVALRSSPDVTCAVWDAGYGSMNNFYRQVGPTLGMTARDYGSGASGRPVAFTVVDHRLGAILVAATPVGVCAIRVGPDAASLEEELRTEFPRAEIRRDDEALRAVTDLVTALADGRDAPRALPLDIEGTAFQVQVWEALSRVGRGERVTYAELARRIGRPSAHRAVGSAVGANPVALALPCHRVVRSDGGLGGYRWGVAVKEALLGAEDSAAGDGSP